MPGGQFGGAGSSGRWSANRGMFRSRYQRPYRSSRLRKSIGVRGGNVHLITPIVINYGTSEDNPVTRVTPFLNAAYWLDAQLQADDTTRWEGELNATKIVNAHFKLECWANTIVDAVVLYLPVFMGIAVIPWYDAGVTQGSPTNWYPVVIPNLFLRDWGRQRDLPEMSDNTAPTGNLGPVEPVRVVFRTFELLYAGDDSLTGTPPRIVSAKCRLRNIVVPKNCHLAAIFGAYNTHLSADVSTGFRLSGTFGYRHFHKS